MAKEYIIKCDNCPASKIIKESMGCNADQLYNRFELLKAAIVQAFYSEYTPNFQCRFADLVEIEERERKEQ
jgi:hypothetical protein